MINTVQFDKELTFAPDATAQNSKAYLPRTLHGNYVELIIYIAFSHGSAAGKIQIQTAPTLEGPYWANVGNTIDWAAEDTMKYAAITGVFGALRLNIDTAVTTGTVRAWAIASNV